MNPNIIVRLLRYAVRAAFAIFFAIGFWLSFWHHDDDLGRQFGLRLIFVAWAVLLPLFLLQKWAERKWPMSQGTAAQDRQGEAAAQINWTGRAVRLAAVLGFMIGFFFVAWATLRTTL